MHKDLVHLVKNETFTDTIVIAEMLEVPHRNLLRTVDDIFNRQKKNTQSRSLKFPQKFIQGEFTNKMNRTYRMYELNEQAYMKLCMHLKGYEKAEVVQDSIIEAFSLMKDSLIRQSNQSWLHVRKSGKITRREETDVIKQFTEYAISQGSKSAKTHYRSITRMTNKALELLTLVKKGEKLLDLAIVTELGFIQVVNNTAIQAMEYGMKKEMNYKDIYQFAKREVNTLCESLTFNRAVSK